MHIRLVKFPSLEPSLINEINDLIGEGWRLCVTHTEMGEWKVEIIHCCIEKVKWNYDPETGRFMADACDYIINHVDSDLAQAFATVILKAKALTQPRG